MEGKQKFHEQDHDYMVQQFDLQSLENVPKRQKIEMNMKQPKNNTPTKTSLLQKSHAVALMPSPKGLQGAMTHQIISTIVHVDGDVREPPSPFEMVERIWKIRHYKQHHVRNEESVGIAPVSNKQ